MSVPRCLANLIEIDEAVEGPTRVRPKDHDAFGFLTPPDDWPEVMRPLVERWPDLPWEHLQPCVYRILLPFTFTQGLKRHWRRDQVVMGRRVFDPDEGDEVTVADAETADWANVQKAVKKARIFLQAIEGDTSAFGDEVRNAVQRWAVAHMLSIDPETARSRDRGGKREARMLIQLWEAMFPAENDRTVVYDPVAKGSKELHASEGACWVLDVMNTLVPQLENEWSRRWLKDRISEVRIKDTLR
jgi:hypothetical protein